MSKATKPKTGLDDILKQVVELRRSLGGVETDLQASPATVGIVNKFVPASGALIKELRIMRERVSPVRFGNIDITLGRSDSIAKFFAFNFISQKKCKLSELVDAPFYGSGVYAIYYHGSTEKAYKPLSCHETPIYVGKADPKDTYAETIEDQGKVLYSRLKEHAKSIGRTNLKLADFYYRSAAIQSGMQSAVEEFMIHLFRPIWNKEIKICFGIGKHRDSATTRTNKRSPWDTMHPGRKWATATTADQMKRDVIEAKIAAHFKGHPIIPNKKKLFNLLLLG